MSDFFLKVVLMGSDYELAKILLDSGIKPHKDKIKDILSMIEQDKLRGLPGLPGLHGLTGALEYVKEKILG